MLSIRLFAALMGLRIWPGTAAAPRRWRFDPASALIGAAVAFVLAALLYRYRNALQRAWLGATRAVGRLGRYLQASLVDDYRALVARRARELVFPRHLAPLEALFVEPILRLPPHVPRGLGEAEPPPRCTQLPLRRALGQHGRLALIGPPGSGKTTVLAYLALAAAQGNVADERIASDPAFSPVLARVPFLFSLATRVWEGSSEPPLAQEAGRGEAPADPLLLAALEMVGGNPKMLGPLRRRLRAGEGLILVDGWDELPAEARPEALAWLARALEATPGNLWLVVAGEQGYGPLIELGCVPVALATWERDQAAALAKRWVRAAAGVAPHDQADAEQVRTVREELWRALGQGALPLELALRAFVLASAGQVPPTAYGALFECVFELLLPGDREAWLAGVCRTVLARLAWRLQHGGSPLAERDELGDLIRAALPPAEEAPARAATRVLRALTGAQSVLCAAPDERLAFAHSEWRTYFAARQALAVGHNELAAHLDDAAWRPVWRFYAEFGEMGPLVSAFVRRPDDAFYSRLCGLAEWIRAAPPGAAWRDGAMALLVRAFLAPRLPPPLRVRLGQAIVASRADGVKYFFGQALRHSDPEIRIATAEALGQVGDEGALALLEGALGDSEGRVQEAAIRSLARLGLAGATRLLGERLEREDDDLLRLTIAEALADSGPEGLAILRDAAKAEDFMVRRSAVFGLARAGEMAMLDALARNDPQWLVRTAATAASAEAEGHAPPQGVPPLPAIEELPWLIAWAAERGEGVAGGEAARATLIRALQEGDAPVQVAALHVLRLVGRAEDLETVRPLLSASDAAVVRTAFDVSQALAQRYDVSLPGERGQGGREPPSG